MKFVVWVKTFISFSALAVFCFLAAGSTDSGSGSGSASSSISSGSSGSSSSESSSSDYATSADRAAMEDLRSNNAWVKDLYVSPGHMNIGVIRGEKDWSSPMIGTYACAVLRNHGSTLSWVRFVDIEAVANQGQSPNQAEIYKFSCP
jgi:hypothetical protein